uniref:Disease resistance RPP13-like protein 1 n=1 Tax=Fagus sylvatica TaxID=28930 RepID=A0A2N9J107_FAGSY
MAGALVGGAFLSAFLQVAFDRLASPEVVNYLKGNKPVDRLLRKLKMELISARVVLNDAEEKQYTNPDVKEWLDELKHAAYDADDILDRIAYEALRCKLEAESQTGTSKVCPFSTSELEEMLDRLKDITENMNVLGLKEVASSGGGVALPSSRLTTSCQEKRVYGRDIDKQAIFELWQSPGASSDGICVVPIVGMGGIGKTTFAQFLYNDAIVNESFHLKAWVCVSENFDIFKIFKTIIEEVTLSQPKTQNLNSLQTEIREALTGKKFFLVLDDVWNENYNAWAELVKVFECGAQEVKIIVTTRSERVASNVRTVPTHYCLTELSNDDCWDLFTQHAFVNRNPNEFLDLVKTGKEIVKKCGCLPLAVKTIGVLILPRCITKLPTHMCKLINLRHLDNTSPKLEEMPPQMGKLKNLRKLSVFVVNKNGGSNTRELGELQQLSGKLSISNLENVHSTEDATEVMLKDKQDLSELELKWKDDHDTDDSEKERNVLEQLCPPKNLKSLTIVNYVGTKFPNWLGDPSFRNMVSIVLLGCKNCFICPSLGQLPYLKKLEIQGFMGEKVGPEFYGNDSSAIEPRFRCLEYLSFENMQEWQEWVIFEGEVFPCLRELHIYDCPKLSRSEVTYAPNLTSPPRLHLPALVSLSLERCPKLESFPEEGLPSNLERLDILNCDKLFSRRREWRWHSLRKLREFKVGSDSEELGNFPEEAWLPSTLTHFDIHSFRNLKLLNGKGFQHLTSLKSLGLTFCDELQCLPEEGLPTSLQSLSIHYCPKLQCLPEEGLPTSLSQLTIRGCPLLEKRWEEEKGEDWEKNALIPWRWINNREIRNPSHGRLLPQLKLTDSVQRGTCSDYLSLRFWNCWWMGRCEVLSRGQVADFGSFFSFNLRGLKSFST